jgi:hypothetical protein
VKRWIGRTGFDTNTTAASSAPAEATTAAVSSVDPPSELRITLCACGKYFARPVCAA